MNRARSPYEVLGLAPGADRSAIEAAYRSLMKKHHPDVSSGDGETAKAITHAYRALARPSPKLPVRVEAPPLPPRRGVRWGRWLLVTALAVLVWWAPWPRIPWERLTSATPRPPVAQAEEQPVPDMLLARVVPDQAAVEAGVSEAQRLERGPEAETVTYSQSCAADLRRLPGDGLLDHCVAFDLAAAHGRSSGLGWFRAEAMARRHAAAAERVLGDPVLAEARVREVERLVERQLVQGPP